MDANDRAAIERLFARLADFEDRAPARDPQAEGYIARRLAAQPGAAYYMAQTIVAQEQALKQAEERLAEAEGRPIRAPGYGHREQAASGPWGRPAARPAAGGFLAGAAQTAMGVAGGVLLGGALSSLFGGSADAAELGDEEIAFDDDAGDFGDFDL